MTQAQQPSRLWQLDTRWMEVIHNRAAGPAQMDPEKIDRDSHIMWAKYLGQDDFRPLEYTEDGIAVVNIVGLLYKDMGNPFVSSYKAAEEAIDELLETSPRAAVVRIDSPGGMVAGLESLCRKIRQLSEQTLTVASINGDGMSAAYRIASQCGSIWASEDSDVGSIGTYWQMLDMSAAYAAEGIRPVMLTTGTLKGVGVMGNPITPEQEQFLQDKVNEANARFLADVAEGRGMSPEAIATASTGAWWLAGEAQGLGLVDEIGDFAAVLSAIRSQIGVTVMPREKLVAPAATAPAAAAPAEPQAEQLTPEPQAAVPPARDLAQYMEAFGDAEGARMFRDGIEWEAAQQQTLSTIRGQVQDLQAENAQLRQRLAEAAEFARGEATPVTTPVAENRRVSLAEAVARRPAK